MLSLVTPGHLVPAEHPLRRVKQLADEALGELSSVFDAMYSRVGRPSIPPERLLKASLLIALYSVRGERQFCEQLRYNFLFRWFLDMNTIEENFDPTGSLTTESGCLLTMLLASSSRRSSTRLAPRV